VESEFSDFASCSLICCAALVTLTITGTTRQSRASTITTKPPAFTFSGPTKRRRPNLSRDGARSSSGSRDTCPGAFGSISQRKRISSRLCWRSIHSALLTRIESGQRRQPQACRYIRRIPTRSAAAHRIRSSRRTNVRDRVATPSAVETSLSPFGRRRAPPSKPRAVLTNKPILARGAESGPTSAQQESFNRSSVESCRYFPPHSKCSVSSERTESAIHSFPQQGESVRAP
jgi:hypothetical protein